jgi:hypothetical protein
VRNFSDGHIHLKDVHSHIHERNTLADNIHGSHAQLLFRTPNARLSLLLLLLLLLLLMMMMLAFSPKHERLCRE